MTLEQRILAVLLGSEFALCVSAIGCSIDEMAYHIFNDAKANGLSKPRFRYSLESLFKAISVLMDRGYLIRTTIWGVNYYMVNEESHYENNF